MSDLWLAAHRTGTCALAYQPKKPPRYRDNIRTRCRHYILGTLGITYGEPTCADCRRLLKLPALPVAPAVPATCGKCQHMGGHMCLHRGMPMRDAFVDKYVEPPSNCPLRETKKSPSLR